MAKISVFLNENASKGSVLYSQRDFEKFFFRHEITVHNPKGLTALNEQILRDIDQGTEYIFSVGGDGTAHTISQNLVNKNVKLMVVPAGTANDFATEVGISSNLKKIFNIFNSMTTKKVDAISVNGHYMLSNGGLGFANDVAKAVDIYRKKYPSFKTAMRTFGKKTYSLVYAHHLFSRPFKTRRILVESPDFPYFDSEVLTPLVMVNNQAYIGGKFRVAPHTKNDDGKFNVTVFLHKNKFDLMKCTIKMMSGVYPHNDPDLISFETEKLVLSSLDLEDLDFFGDGESFPPSKVLNITIIKQGIEVCIYKGESLLCSSYSLEDIEMIQ